jgi:hypothetical protein
MLSEDKKLEKSCVGGTILVMGISKMCILIRICEGLKKGKSQTFSFLNAWKAESWSISIKAVITSCK